MLDKLKQIPLGYEAVVKEIIKLGPGFKGKDEKLEFDK